MSDYVVNHRNLFAEVLGAESMAWTYARDKTIVADYIATTKEGMMRCIKFNPDVHPIAKVKVEDNKVVVIPNERPLRYYGDQLNFIDDSNTAEENAAIRERIARIPAIEAILALLGASGHAIRTSEFFDKLSETSFVRVSIIAPESCYNPTPEGIAQLFKKLDDFQWAFNEKAYLAKKVAAEEARKKDEAEKARKETIKEQRAIRKGKNKTTADVPSANPSRVPGSAPASEPAPQWITIVRGRKETAAPATATPSAASQIPVVSTAAMPAQPSVSFAAVATASANSTPVPKGGAAAATATRTPMPTPTSTHIPTPTSALQQKQETPKQRLQRLKKEQEDAEAAYKKEQEERAAAIAKEEEAVKKHHSTVLRNMMATANELGKEFVEEFLAQLQSKGVAGSWAFEAEEDEHNNA